MKQQDIVHAIENASYAQGYIDAKTERDDIYEALQYTINILTGILLNMDSDGNKDSNNGCMGCKYERKEIDEFPCNMCKHSYCCQWTPEERE